MVTSALPLVYVSYAWGDTTEDGRVRELIVDELCAAVPISVVVRSRCLH
jgi:hypothetical protein